MTTPLAPFPDPFLLADGQRVSSPEGWPRRRKEILSLIQREYGPLPPVPPATTGEPLYQWTVDRWHKAAHHTVRIHTAGIHFTLELTIPPGGGPFPVLVNGDTCWHRLDDDMIREIISRGYALATFNRLEVAHDNAKLPRVQGLDPSRPDALFGSVAGWAWAYHRVVDVLETRPDIRKDQIAVAGHSRGGKAVLLAGATDERIALTAPNNSGCGGAGSYLWQPDNCEALDRMTQVFPHWLGSDFKVGKGEEKHLGFDQHFVKALVAPRAYLSTEALGDTWANPEGSWQTHRAARTVWQFLGAGHRTAIRYREGGHDHSLLDWKALMDFADVVFRGTPLPFGFEDHPFRDLPVPHHWTIPG